MREITAKSKFETASAPDPIPEKLHEACHDLQNPEAGNRLYGLETLQTAVKGNNGLAAAARVMAREHARTEMDPALIAFALQIAEYTPLPN